MKKLSTYLIPLLFGVIFIPIPLVGDFHFESAMFVTIIGCFWGGLKAGNSILKKDSVLLIKIFRSVYLFGFPLLVFAVLRNCLTVHGAGFWILIPIPGILFGVAIGRFFRKLIVPFPAFFTLLSLLFVSLGVLLIEFLTLPQVYFFNHIWGIWPGPIYDETVLINSGFIFFRFITLGWILVLWLLPDWKSSKKTKPVVFLVILGLISGYFFLPDLGIITPRSHLKDTLKEYGTEHFDLYYSDLTFEDEEIKYWALKHEFHFQQIVGLLEIDWPENRKIESYMYANAWQKKKLVGAKFTSYVPIWLKQDQLHIAKKHLGGTLKHELVHVISKQFGNRLFNGSWSIGLVEGLAEGIAKDASSQSTLNQILAADPPFPTPKQMKNALSFSGFYSSAGSISYTTTGSFVGYLLENYPVSNFKEAYSNSSFESSYQIPFDSLVIAWQRSLPIVEIDSVDQQVSNFIFSQQSIFQKPCPHTVSWQRELWDRILYLESYQNKAEALSVIDALYAMVPENLIIKRKWIRYQLENGNLDGAFNSIAREDSLSTFSFLKADAAALSGDWERAYNQLKTIGSSVSQNFIYSFQLREDSLQWNYFLGTRYQNKIPLISDFTYLNTSNQLLSIEKAIEMNHYSGVLPAFSDLAFQREKNLDWFNTYETIIDRLVFLNEFGEAQNWITEIEQLPLRPRYQERLQEQKEWMRFGKKHHSN